MRFLKIANIDSKNSLFKQDTIINLGLKDGPFDANIGNIIIEVTLTLDQKEYLIRRHLCSLYGNTNMPLDFRTYNQLLINSFPLPVIDAIKRKCDGKQYASNEPYGTWLGGAREDAIERTTQDLLNKS